MRVQKNIALFVFFTTTLVPVETLTALNKNIVGAWHNTPGKSFTLGEKYVFSSQGEFIIKASGWIHKNGKYFYARSGKWQIAGSKLILNYSYQRVVAGGKLKHNKEGASYITGGKAIWEKCDEVDSLAFEGPLYDKRYNIPKIVINGSSYWKINTRARDKVTSLFAAVESNNRTDAEIALLLGADVNSDKMYGWTPLHEACKDNYFDIAKFLIEKGADINSSDKEGYRPLYLAVKNKNVRLARYLIQKGAFVNMQADPLGALLTPLHIAVINKDVEMVKLLLENGADWSIKTARGKTALDLARKEKNEKIEGLILKYSQGSARLNIKDKYIHLIKGRKTRTLGKLASSDAPGCFGFLSLYKFSPDSTYVVFVEKTKNGYNLFLASNKGERARVTCDGKIDGRTSISWDKNGRAFLFNENGRIYIFSTKGYWQNTLTNPPDGYEDIKPSFKGMHMVKFFRGTRFEYSFSGSEYEVRITGSHCRRVPGGETIKPEGLRGAEDEGEY